MDAVANSSGAVIETRGYDAFGKPRDGTWNDLTPAKIASTAVTPKGFTQHEHLNQLELIHMNGRALDYHPGRFTGVDPFIQFPLNSQSLNPYSYILNNPLSGTDPTGYACDVAGDATECANSAGAGGEQKVYQQNAGSHIKTTVGAVKNNGDGSATFTNNAGQSRTIGENGGTRAQGVTGSEGRKDRAASSSEKGSTSNANERMSNAAGGGPYDVADNWTENDGMLSCDDGGREDRQDPTADQLQKSRDLDIRAYEIVSKPPGSDGIVDLDYETEFLAVFDAEIHRIALRSMSVGGYENLNDAGFLYNEAYRRGDSLFYGGYAGGRWYRINGAPFGGGHFLVET